MFDVAIVGGGPAGVELRGFLRERRSANALARAREFSARKSLRRLSEPGVLADFAATHWRNAFGACRMACWIAVDFIGIGGRIAGGGLAAATKRKSPSSAVSSINCSWRRRANSARRFAKEARSPRLTAPERGDARIGRSRPRTNFRGAHRSSPRMAAIRPSRGFAACCREARRSASRCKLICHCRRISEIASCCNFCREGYSGQAPVGTTN